MRDYIKIANAHIEAKLNNTFTNPPVTTREEVMDALHKGETFEQLMNEITYRYVTITSLLYSSALGHTTEAYKKSVRRGFRELLKHYDK